MTIKNLVYVLAVAFGISFLDGALTLDLPSGFNTILGIVDVVAIVWLVIKVSKEA
jgi:hypothetical protein